MEIQTYISNITQKQLAEKKSFFSESQIVRSRRDVDMKKPYNEKTANSKKRSWHRHFVTSNGVTEKKVIPSFFL